MRLMAVWLIPTFLAIERVLQCVASAGLLSRVSVTTRPTSASVIFRGAPGRGSSGRPSSRRARKRARHFPTVCFLIRSSAAVAMFGRP
jgi:hypothetical protein